MSHQSVQLKIFFVILFLKVTFGITINNSNNSSQVTSRTVKKQLITNNETIISSDNNNGNIYNNNNPVPEHTLVTHHSSPPTTAQLPQIKNINKNDDNHVNMKSLKDLEIPDSYRIGFYIFIGIGVLAVLFFSCRSYKLRLSRAERRYGVHGDRRAQELIPLPMSVEDDSDTEDHTVFDINKQIRIS